MLSLQWYMISVVYVYHRMKSCEVLCYINGRLALRQDVGFVNTSEVSSVSSDPKNIRDFKNYLLRQHFSVKSDVARRMQFK